MEDFKEREIELRAQIWGPYRYTLAVRDGVNLFETINDGAVVLFKPCPDLTFREYDFYMSTIKNVVRCDNWRIVTKDPIYQAALDVFNLQCLD